MDAAMSKNNNNDQEVLFTCSQPNPDTTPSIYNTGKRGKRGNPESPENLPGTQKQQTRQIRRRNSIGDISETLKKKPASLNKSVANKVLEALSSPEVLDTIIPVLTQKLSEALSPIIEAEVKNCIEEQIKPMSEKIISQEKEIANNYQNICKLFIQVNRLEKCCKDRIDQIKEQDKELDAQCNAIKDLETRLENQEQYSRRTSVRFHNVPVPIDEQGKIKHPVNTDHLILDICQNKMNLDININDIGRTHVIGKARNGKSQIIARFVSYRKKHLVYSNKKLLKYNENGTFITENLTKFRTTLVQSLAQMKYDGNIIAYWTADGKIFAKRTENSQKKIITEWEDIHALRRPMRDQDDQTEAQASEPIPGQRP
ncbi:unnamed protein product [Mytilus edulis]|uniref:Uncharacterized protein n=1 Tax=Mytilus edulis TaxID=6550 RepID=A0A8S3PSP1_MYTED|nr:unnamed protein product [Mytilus edulis]